MFLDRAVALVRTEDWDNSELYDLILQIYSLSVEVESARGTFDLSEKRIVAIIEHAKHPRDTVRAIAARAKAYGTRQEYGAARLELRKALIILGVKVPPWRKMRHIIEVHMIKRMLLKYTEQDLLGLKPMSDQSMLSVMEILQMGVVWGFNADDNFS